MGGSADSTIQAPANYLLKYYLCGPRWSSAITRAVVGGAFAQSQGVGVYHYAPSRPNNTDQDEELIRHLQVDFGVDFVLLAGYLRVCLQAYAAPHSSNNNTQNRGDGAQSKPNASRITLPVQCCTGGNSCHQPKLHRCIPDDAS